MLVSWLMNAAAPDSGVRSLLSGEGLRWLLGRFADTLAMPLLVWLVLLSMAYGCLLRSGLLRRPATYREQRALPLALAVLAAIVIVMVLLTAVPHAVLLSVTGSLWPSPFSASLPSVVAFTVVLVSSVYGTVAGTFGRVADIYDALIDGLHRGAPLLLFYVLLAQLYYSLAFAFLQQ